MQGLKAVDVSAETCQRANTADVIAKSTMQGVHRAILSAHLPVLQRLPL